jgi:hypothetical protein
MLRFIVIAAEQGSRTGLRGAARKEAAGSGAGADPVGIVMSSPGRPRPPGCGSN